MTAKIKNAKLQPSKGWLSPLRLANFCMLFALVGVLFLVFSQAATIAGYYGSIENDQVARINSARQDNGKATLQHIECLNTVAELWTKKMADAGSISHNPNLGNEVSYVCGNSWSVLGENVGVGYDSASLFSAFMASPPHKANILDSRFLKTGVGAYKTTDDKLWVTQVFAKCDTCTGNWATTASVPTDPSAPAAATGNGYFMRNSNTGGIADFSFNYGNSSDVSVFCDWDGNGTDTAGVFRKGVFYLSNDNKVAFTSFAYGNSDDVPLCGDWDGNGTDTVGVYRSSNSAFYIRNNNSSGASDASFRYGDKGDKPLVGDWDGNGKDTVGIWRGSGFYLKNSLAGGGADVQFTYGISTDKPLVGDWDGNGIDTPGVWRNGVFYLRNTNTGGGADLSFSYGNSSDLPLTGDWDGNKTTTIGIRR